MISIPDAYADPRFNPQVDAATGYRTRNLLCVPMTNTHGEVVGVIQALNRRDGAFGAEDEELLARWPARPPAPSRTRVLHEEIERLFEGFVQASVVAIEARDPTTAGHSEPRGHPHHGLARAVEPAPPPPWAIRRRRRRRRWCPLPLAWLHVRIARFGSRARWGNRSHLRPECVTI